jgi:hypothetical protein
MSDESSLKDRLYAYEHWHGPIRSDMGYGPYTIERLAEMLKADLEECPLAEIRIKLADPLKVKDGKLSKG